MALSFFDTENRGRTILFAVTGAIFSAGLMAAMWVPVFISKTEDGPTLQKNYLDLCRVDKCGLTGPKFAERRIVRGRDALDDEFPYQVAFWSLLNPFVIFCSGNMINDRWVLTVAHCLEGRYIPYVRMSAGIMKVEEGWSNSIQILDYWIHPERVIKRNLHDIALIKTKQSIESASSHFVSPICLPFSDLTTTDSDRVSVAGFGLTSENGSGSDNLLAVNLQIQPNRNCRVYASFRPESMICAGVSDYLSSIHLTPQHRLPTK